MSSNDHPTNSSNYDIAVSQVSFNNPEQRHRMRPSSRWTPSPKQLVHYRNGFRASAGYSTHPIYLRRGPPALSARPSTHMGRAHFNTRFPSTVIVLLKVESTGSQDLE